MAQLGNIKSSIMIKYLEHLGFRKSRQKGSHIFFRHIDGRTATVPVHKGEDLCKGLITSILRDIEVSKNDFLEWLGK